MTWNHIVQRVAERTGLSVPTVRLVCHQLAEVITEELRAGHAVRFPSLGIFASAWQPSRTVRAVGGGPELTLRGQRVARFRASAALKRALAPSRPRLVRPASEGLPRVWPLAAAR